MHVDDAETTRQAIAAGLLDSSLDMLAEAIRLRQQASNLDACDGCNGSGIYHGAGRVENGVFIGFKGQCFRCGGKGSQNEADRKRNWGYDRNRRVSA